MPRKVKEAPVEVKEVKEESEVKEVKEESEVKEAPAEDKKENPKRKRSLPKQKELKEDVLAKVKQGLKELLAMC